MPQPRAARTPATTPLAPLLEAGRRARREPAPPSRRASPTAPRIASASPRCSATLPDRYRIPVVLRHVDDLSYAELAEVLGRPEGTVKAQVSRGLAMLRAAAAGTELEELTA